MSTGLSEPEKKAGRQSTIQGGQPPPIFVSVREAARLLDTCRTRIYELMAKGELLHVRDGSRRKIEFRSIVERAERLAAEQRDARPNGARVAAAVEARRRKRRAAEPLTSAP